MDINRIRILTTFLFMFILCSLLLPLSIQAASRGISVVTDLSHQSGKLGAYRALIIGINDYKDPKIPDLETAVNDARAMADLLQERYGFKVKLLLNRKATRRTIYKALRNMASTTKPNDSVLIYYAGHGDLDRTYNDGWWIPADAKGGDPVTYLDNGQVQKSMRSMEARHVLLISDACYSGTLFGQARAMPSVIDNKYYLNLYNEKSRWGMTSGNKTPVSDTGSGGHSVFAYQLLKELRKNEKPYISTQEIYTRIAPIVGNNSEQTPICRPIRNTGDQGGEFVFVASSSAMTDIKVDTDKDTNKQLAYITQVSSKVEPDSRLALAIFPWHYSISDNYTYKWARFFMQDAFKAFFRIVGRHDDIELTYSYHADKVFKYNRTDTEHLKKVIPKKEWKKVWFKKSFFAREEPDLNIVYSYGSKVGVDLAFMLDFDVNYDLGRIKTNAYLLDIKNKNVFKESKVIDLGGNFNNEVTPLFDKIVNDFVEDRKTDN